MKLDDVQIELELEDVKLEFELSELVGKRGAGANVPALFLKLRGSFQPPSFLKKFQLSSQELMSWLVRPSTRGKSV